LIFAIIFRSAGKVIVKVAEPLAQDSDDHGISDGEEVMAMIMPRLA